MYPFNSTEQAIEQRYNALGLTAPISTRQLARSARVFVRLADADGASNSKRRTIVLDRSKDRLELREDFAHELAHILIHFGSQWFSADTWVDLQEREADRLALYILVPSHLLIPFLESVQPRTESEVIAAIAQTFHVTLDFARRRYRKLQAQIEGARRQQQLDFVMETMPQYGRDFDNRLTIGRTEYFYRQGSVVFQRRVAEE